MQGGHDVLVPQTIRGKSRISSGCSVASEVGCENLDFRVRRDVVPLALIGEVDITAAEFGTVTTAGEPGVRLNVAEKPIPATSTDPAAGWLPDITSRNSPNPKKFCGNASQNSVPFVSIAWAIAGVVTDAQMINASHEMTRVRNLSRGR